LARTFDADVSVILDMAIFFDGDVMIDANRVAIAAAVSAAIVISVAAVRMGAEDRAAGLKELADAERAFARLSLAKGVAHSFHEHFAEDGIGFNPQPVKVKAEMAKRPPLDLSKPRATLDWYPVLSDLAASGEMGFNLGPSLLTPAPGDDKNKPRHGYFFSVWKRQADGKFKVVLDIGSDTSGPVAGDSPDAWRAVKTEPWRAPASVSIEKETATLREQDATLSAAIAKRGATAAYGDALAPDFRVFDNTFAPALDKAAVAAHLQKIGARADRNFTVQHAEVAKSADVGYTWGSYLTPRAVPEKGHYAHYWRKNAKGDWRLVVEIIRPDPPPAK
jgi:ketosteroid isomerase-like protein